MSYENKILAMKKMMKKKAPQTDQKPVYQKPAPPSYSAKWERAGLRRIDNEFGTVFVREVTYSFDDVHGDIVLGDFFKALDMWQASDHPIALDAASSIVFYDTETTGLKGTGTHIFLNGLLTFDDEQFTLKQYVLADPSHEAAFLFESKLWQRGKSVVTYNGKSFDWPQLEMRWTFHRDILPQLPKPAHVDLMHIAKRIWKSDIDSMKLSAIEREKLGFKRIGDVPGYLAPVIYLDAVRSGETDALMKVLTHNEYDLLSLVTLYTKATQLLTEGVGEASAQAYTNIGKWYKDLKATDDSLALLREVTAVYDVIEAAEASFYEGYLLKKQQDFVGAFNSFTLCIPYIGERQKIEAYVELAKLCEHQLGDIAAALRYSEHALALATDSTCYKASAKIKRIDALSHRIKRLMHKNML